MGHELTEQKTGALVDALDQQELGAMLKPLIREIHLFDSYVAGTSYLQDKSVLEQIHVDDRLILRREDNKFDEHAILIFTMEPKKLGYIPEKDNLIFARLMDAGKMLGARIKKIDTKGSFTQISIGIYLVDF